MKITLNRIAFATCLALGATVAQANDNFVGLTWGQTDNNIQKSNALNANLGNPKLDKVIDGEGTWGIRAGQKTADGRYYATYENVSDSHNGYKLRQQNLLGSYDMFVPLPEKESPMKKLSTLAIATTFGIFSLGTHAAENFAGFTWGESTVNTDRSSSLKQNMDGKNRFDDVIKNSGTWGVRAGQMTDEGRYYMTYENVSDDYGSSLKLRQQNLIGSYDMFVPLGSNNTKLFGGVTAGLVKLEQESRGFSRDSDIGFAAGLQAGILQELNSNTSIEAGYRYLRTNASTEMAPRGEGKAGSLDLHSSSQLYLGANFAF